MSLIEARNYESAAELRERYKAAKRSLWGKPPQREPVAIAPEPVIEVVAPPEPDPPRAKPHKVFSEDDYAKFIAKLGIPEQIVNRALKTLLVVSSHYSLTVAELKGGARTKKYITPRHIAMYIMIRGLGFSYPRTGHELGGRDHTTVLYGTKQIGARILRDPEFAAHVQELMRLSTG